MEGLLSGVIPISTKPKQAHNMNPDVHSEWTDTPAAYKTWSSRYSSLRKLVGKEMDRMEQDCIAYGHDLAMVKASRAAEDPTPWHCSKAYTSLKQDVKDGRHLGVEPKELYNDPDRPEYRAFNLSKFRKHLYQIIDAEPKRAIRFEKKKAKWQFPTLHKDHPRNNNNRNERDEGDD